MGTWRSSCPYVYTSGMLLATGTVGVLGESGVSVGCSCNLTRGDLMIIGIPSRTRCCHTRVMEENALHMYRNRNAVY